MSNTQQSTQSTATTAGLQRDPDHWKTGGEPMTAAQDSYLHTLAEQVGTPVPDELTKAEASKQIDALRAQVTQGDSENRAALAPHSGAHQEGLRKDPDDWKTGDEPMTAAQSSYLHTLAEQAGNPVSDRLTKAEAAKQIDSLQEKTGRGQPSAASHGSEANGRRR